ncbi:hypothetical protein BJY00DRAFT_323521 [Aspergillus carlsbadensis]|nr:hypothetical protein BJY00DRAFT_323521 [Aspergillus carlsbadensis]
MSPDNDTLAPDTAESPESTSNYTPWNQPYNPYPSVKLIIVGAGIGGIAASILISRKVPNLSYTVYDRNHTVGGTWTQNRYPGVRCDVPSHAYQLTFAPNPRWSQYYAPGSEIREYYERVVDEYGVKEHLRLRHEVQRAEWSDELSQWKVGIKNLDTGEIFTETVQFFVSAAGRLNVPKMPDIPGLDDFQGHQCHTAAWDTGFDYQGKNLAVIGNGASGQQVLSNTVAGAAHIDQYVRSKQWITPKFADSFVGATSDSPGGRNFTEAEKYTFENDPKAYLEFRQNLEKNLHGGLKFYTTGSKENDAVQARCLDTMLTRVNGDKEFLQKILPDYPPGCKRITPSPGYLEALISPKVTYIDTPIMRITATGIITADNIHRTVDAIIAATGFQNGFLPLFPTIGKNGTDLSRRWAPDGPIGFPETYFGVMAPDMPNWFAVLQAQSYSAGGTVPLQCEISATYIAKVIRKVQSQGYSSIYPSHEATADFNEIASHFFDDKVLGEACNSWMKLGPGRSRNLVWWPGTAHHRMGISRDPRWEDFVFEKAEGARGNRFAYFGNGWTERERVGGVASMTNYLKEAGKVDLAVLHEAWNE